MRVLAGAGRRIALGIHRHEQHARTVRRGQRGPGFFGHAQALKRGRADVGAMREAEENQGPVAAQGIGRQTTDLLLKKFRSVNKIRELTEAELAEAIGSSKAALIRKHFEGKK